MKIKSNTNCNSYCIDIIFNTADIALISDRKYENMLNDSHVKHRLLILNNYIIKLKTLIVSFPFFATENIN